MLLRVYMWQGGEAGRCWGEEGKGGEEGEEKKYRESPSEANGSSFFESG